LISALEITDQEKEREGVLSLQNLELNFYHSVSDKGETWHSFQPVNETKYNQL